MGMRSLSGFASGYPNMRGHVTPHSATIAEILQENGYFTFMAGKWHLVPPSQESGAGPFDQWPLQRGFNRYYVFLGGMTDQYYPQLVCENHRVFPPKGPEEGYHISKHKDKGVKSSFDLCFKFSELFLT